MPPDPPDPSGGVLLAKLRKALISNEYRSANVDELISAEGTAAYLDGWYGPARRRTQPDTPLGTLVRLFSLGMDVSAVDLDDVPGADVSDWTEAGLVAVRRRVAHPLVAIRPLRVWGAETHLVCDAQVPDLGPSPFSQFVRGVTPSSTQLANMTLRRPFRRALDMGTGEGIQAILASHHCQEVVATDVNPRALAFARFNLVWNGVEQVELRSGDRYAPVEGEQFDLVVSNPPYWITPAMSALFWDSGLPTDTMSATAVSGAAEHLAPGGWAFLTCQWATEDNERWQDRVKSWLAGSGCDAWAVQRRAADPVDHAVEGLAVLGRVDPKEADRRFEQWIGYLSDEGIVDVGSGFLVLRKTDGEPWYRADELQFEPTNQCGEAIAALFDTEDWLRAHPKPGAALDARWRLAEHVHLETTQDATVRQWVASKYVLRQGDGLRTSAKITKDLAEILPRCDGRQALRAIVGELLKGRWRDPVRHELEIESAIRQLAAAGFLVPVTEAP